MRKTLLMLAAAFVAGYTPVQVHAAEARAGHVVQATAEDPLIEVTVTTPGTLGSMILNHVSSLRDVTHLKINGSLNTDDWITIQNLTNIQELDLSGANIKSIPDFTFYDRQTLKNVILPEGLETIGNATFCSSSIEKINIPSSVTSIQPYCFQVSKLKEITFSLGSKLEKFEHGIFDSCSELKICHIPEGCKEIGGIMFRGCTVLEDVTLPKSLRVIGQSAFEGCRKLKNIKFPENLETIESGAFMGTGLISVILPENLKELGTQVFTLCNNLKTVQLPVHDNLYKTSNGETYGYSETFAYSDYITKIICPAITPPTFSTYAYNKIEPFTMADKSRVTLIVPDFAVDSYKLDEYWGQFNVQGGATPSFYSTSRPLYLGDGVRIGGTADMVINGGGSIFIDGEDPQAFGALTLNHNWTSPNSFSFAQLVNNSPNLTASDVNVNIDVKAGAWYFFTPSFPIKRSQIKHSVESAAMAIRYYDGEKRAANGSGGWTDIADDETMMVGRGYIVQSNTDGTLQMHLHIPIPQLVAGMTAPREVSLNLMEYPAESEADAGWNFLGNPFPSYFDTQYIDFEAPLTVYDHVNKNYKAYSMIDDQFVLHPMQTFFVQNLEDVDKITFFQDGRQTTSTPNSGISKAAKFINSQRLVCNITLSGNGCSDRTRVVVNPEASLDYERTCDAAKMMGESSSLQLWSVGANAIPMAINERPIANGEVSLVAMVPGAGDYELTMETDADVTILDHLTGVTAKQHRFHADKAETIEGRFTLIISEADLSGIGSVSAPQTLSIDGNTVTAGGYMEVYTIDGIKAATLTAGDSTELSAGMYIARCGDGTIFKFVVK